MKPKFSVYVLNDYKSLLGIANTPFQVQVLVERCSPVAFCDVEIVDNELKAKYSYYDFADEYNFEIGAYKK